MSDTTTPPPYLGRCETTGCNYALFVASPDQIKDAENWRDVARHGVPYRVSNYGVFARCPANHKVFRLRQIKGTYSKDHKCDARCLNAKGHECTCSCGGMNHGRGYAINVVPAAEREPQHIGAVGKHIIGQAVCTSIIEHARYTLYVFTTSKGDTLKTFAPEPLPFEQGKNYKIRALVKRHDNHERFGKSTIIEDPVVVEEQLSLNA